MVNAEVLIPETDAAARTFLAQASTTQLTPAQLLVTARDLLARVEAQDEVQVALGSVLIDKIRDWLADYRKES